MTQHATPAEPGPAAAEPGRGPSFTRRRMLGTAAATAAASAAALALPPNLRRALSQTPSRPAPPAACPTSSTW